MNYKRVQIFDDKINVERLLIDNIDKKDWNNLYIIYFDYYLKSLEQIENERRHVFEFIHNNLKENHFLLIIDKEMMESIK
jgi:predicted N-acyltransferase